VDIPQGSENRLKRIMELKGYDEQKALEFAISLAWMVTEQRADKEKIKEKLKVPLSVISDE